MRRLPYVLGLVSALCISQPAAAQTCHLVATNIPGSSSGGDLHADAVTGGDPTQCAPLPYTTGSFKTILVIDGGLGQPSSLMCSTFGAGSPTGGPLTGGPYPGCYALGTNTAVWTGVSFSAYQYGCKSIQSAHYHFSGANGTGTPNLITSPPGFACGGDPPEDPSTEECEYDWSEETQSWYQVWCPSPIIIPIGRDKRTLKSKDYKLTDAANGVRFDIDGDGVDDQIAWTHADSRLAFLALDRNGNGKIDNGKELFGNYTHPGKTNGFAALRVDAGDVGMIKKGNALFDKLLLWEDENHNGLSEPYEIHKFSYFYVGLDEGYVPDNLVDQHGNAFRFKGTAVLRRTGATDDYHTDPRLFVPIWDVFFVTR